VAETNVGWVSHESTYSEMIELKPDASELQEAVTKTVQEGGINESDDKSV
jgi:hypothetical protein